MYIATALIKGYAQIGPIRGSIDAICTGIVPGRQIATVNKQQFVHALTEVGCCY